MFKNISPARLGVTGRQSELIELALTYGFRGLDLDMRDFYKRVRLRGLDHARRYVDSAKIKIGEWELPISWRGPETPFKADLLQLEEMADIAASLGATRCWTAVLPASDELPYHENFERHRQRLAQIGEVLARKDIRLGLHLLPEPERREGKAHEFIHQVEPLLLLIKSIAAPNVGLVLDTWSWLFGDGGFDQLEELEAQQIVAVRLADAPAEADKESVNSEQRLLPGEGQLVDNVRTLRMLAEKGYQGPVTPVPSPACFTGMTRDGIVQRAAKQLDAVWQAAGLSKSGRILPGAAQRAEA